MMLTSVLNSAFSKSHCILDPGPQMNETHLPSPAHSLFGEAPNQPEGMEGFFSFSVVSPFHFPSINYTISLQKNSLKGSSILYSPTTGVFASSFHWLFSSSCHLSRSNSPQLFELSVALNTADHSPKNTVLVRLHHYNEIPEVGKLLKLWAYLAHNSGSSKSWCLHQLSSGPTQLHCIMVDGNGGVQVRGSNHIWRQKSKGEPSGTGLRLL